MPCPFLTFAALSNVCSFMNIPLCSFVHLIKFLSTLPVTFFCFFYPQCVLWVLVSLNFLSSLCAHRISLVFFWFLTLFFCISDSPSNFLTFSWYFQHFLVKGYLGQVFSSLFFLCLIPSFLLILSTMFLHSQSFLILVCPLTYSKLSSRLLACFFCLLTKRNEVNICGMHKRSQPNDHCRKIFIQQ